MTIASSTEPLLTLYNRHNAACGEPPHLTNNDRGRYIGYFANEHGDQWLFVDDPPTGTAILRCGDANWATTYRIHGPDDLPSHMNDAERTWARICWQAASFSMRERAQMAAPSAFGSERAAA